MALAQIQVIVARIMWEFDFKQAEGALGKVGQGDPLSKNGRHRVSEYQIRANVTSQGDGPYLCFRKRQLNNFQQ